MSGDQLNRVKTNIDGLDDMLYGGIPEGNQIIVAGGPGTGKSLMSFEFLYRKAKEGVNSAFIALEEKPDMLIRNVKSAFDFEDLDKLIKSEKLIIGGESTATRLAAEGNSGSYSFGTVVSDMESIIKSNNAKCVVIDSLSLLKLIFEDNTEYRRSIVSLLADLRRMGVTSIVTVEMEQSDRDSLKFGTEFFVFDGIIIFYEMGEENKRMLTSEIVKMRGTDHSWALVPYEISRDGFKFYTV